MNLKSAIKTTNPDKQMSFQTSIISKCCRATAVCMAALALSACTDDTFNELRNNNEAPLTFSVDAPDIWSEISARSSHPDNVEIRRIDGGEAEPLYLVTETVTMPDSLVSEKAPVESSRGVIATTDRFHSSFGLSAICYTGTWSDESEQASQWTTNFAHNLRMTKSGTGWQPDNGKKLEWTGSGRVKFLAYAPHSADIAHGSLNHCPVGTHGLPTLTFEVAADAAKQADLLVATVDADAKAGGEVKLVFRHALTAVTLKTGGEVLPGTVTKVSFENVASRGTVTLGTGVWTADASSCKTFSIEMNKELEPTESDPLKTAEGQEIVGGDLTFLMVPQTLGDDAALVINFTDKLSNTPRTLRAPLKGAKWGAGTKVAYLLNKSGIYYDVSDIDFDFETVQPTQVTVSGNATGIKTTDRTIPTSGYISEFGIKAHAKVYQLDDHSNKISESFVDLPVKVEYSATPDDEASWQDANWHKETSPDYTATKAFGYDRGTITLVPREVFKTMRGNLPTNTPKGTAEAPEDLSNNGETANCYMVNAPGYYCLPLVYGNARGSKNGDLAYKGPTDVPAVWDDLVLKGFRDHNDDVITGPNINGATEAVIVWQDSPDLVRNPYIKKISGTDMLCFQIDKDAICQGNAVIAVRDKDHTVLWSWHIWVTEKTWTTTITKTGKDNQTYAFPTCNLGYVEAHAKDDAEKKYAIRVTATKPDGTTATAVKRDFIQNIIEASYAGDNPYYQWGRKDPMLPGIWNEKTIARANEYYANAATRSAWQQYDMDNKPYYPGAYAFQNKDCKGGQTIGFTIRNPHLFLSHGNPGNIKLIEDDYWRRHWHGGTGGSGHRTLINYWDSQLKYAYNNNDVNVTKSWEVSELQAKPTKSIYDPCPVGFCVPNTNAFTWMSTQTKNNTVYEGNAELNITRKKGTVTGATNENVGWYFGGASETDFFLPATGLRDMGEGSVPLPLIYKNNNEIWTNAAHRCVSFVATTNFERSPDVNYHLNDSRYYDSTSRRDIGDGIKTPTTGETVLQLAERMERVYNVETMAGYNKYGWASSCLIMYIDDRRLYTSGNPYITISGRSQNSYGLNVRPIKEE